MEDGEQIVIANAGRPVAVLSLWRPPKNRIAPPGHMKDKGWWQADADRISGKARTLIENSEDGVYASRASLWEMAVKAGTGKLKVDLSMFASEVTHIGFLWLDIENRHILRLPGIPIFDHHKDPFDRLLISQAKEESMLLLSTDSALSVYGDNVLLF